MKMSVVRTGWYEGMALPALMKVSQHMGTCVVKDCSEEAFTPVLVYAETAHTAKDGSGYGADGYICNEHKYLATEPYPTCSLCGMEYSGPPGDFPESGMCPMCDPAFEEERQKAAAVLAAYEEADRILEETARESFVGV